jgi:hypothetical protein
MGLLMIVFFSQCKMKHKTFCCGEGHQAWHLVFMPGVSNAVPEFIDPVFAKTSQNASFLLRCHAGPSKFWQLGKAYNFNGGDQRKPINLCVKWKLFMHW